MRSRDVLTRQESRRSLDQGIVDAIRDPLLVLDKELRVITASRSFYLAFNMARQDVEGRSLRCLGSGEWDIPALNLLLERVLPHRSNMEAFEVEREVSGIGRRTLVLNARAACVHGPGEQVILLGMEDVTERRSAQRELRKLLEIKDVQLQELQHRVANSLAIIASILLLKARTVQSEETRLHLKDAHHRVLSVATIQRQIDATRNGQLVDIGPYLTKLCEALAGSMIREARPIVLKVKVADGTASSSHAVSIGLIVTELVINSLKHGFAVDRNDGEITVAYEAAEDHWQLSVSDNGGGKPAGVGESKPGLGTTIVTALAQQLDASVETSSDEHGTRVSITHAP